MWKEEPKHQGKVYESTYEFITKIMNGEPNQEKLNWTKIDKFNVGRPKNARNAPIKRTVLGILAILYLAFGFLLWIGVKLFSSKPSAYRFATCVFKWPKMFGPLIRALQFMNPPVQKTINRRTIASY